MPDGHALRGPGVAKVRHPSTVRTRTVELIAGTDPYWAELLEDADIVSEGMASPEQAVVVYRGSTSILITDDRHGGRVPSWDARAVVRLARRDPHFRLRVMRLALREARSRCPGSMGSLAMDVNIFLDPRGIRADIDVEAQVLSAPGKVKAGA